MDNTRDIQENILSLDWRDFSAYPSKGQCMMVHAEGYDTFEKNWKHFFFEIESFDPLDFPNKEMEKKLGEHHCKWKYTWLPPIKQ